MALSVKGFQMERSNLMSRLKGKNIELRKKEDFSLANYFKIAQLKRQIAQMIGALSQTKGRDSRRSLRPLR